MFSSYRVEALRPDGWHVQRRLSPSQAAQALRIHRGPMAHLTSKIIVKPDFPLVVESEFDHEPTT